MNIKLSNTFNEVIIDEEDYKRVFKINWSNVGLRQELNHEIEQHEGDRPEKGLVKVKDFLK